MTLGVAGHPFDWHLHLVWLLVVVALIAGSLGECGRGRDQGRRQAAKVPLRLGRRAPGLAVTWPLADVAAHWLLVALVLQRLLLAGRAAAAGARDAEALLVRLTRPVMVDAVLRVVVRPIPAIAVVTVVAVGTLTTGAVSWAAGCPVAQAVLEVVVLASGFVLWAPVLHGLPGAPKLSALGRGAYLIVQSIVPSFLSIVWIFARHPLYTPFAHAGRSSTCPRCSTRSSGLRGQARDDLRAVDGGVRAHDPCETAGAPAGTPSR